LILKKGLIMKNAGMLTLAFPIENDSRVIGTDESEGE